jgi:hypothetical protein
VADDLGREAVAGVQRIGSWHHAVPVPGSAPARNLSRANLMVPLGRSPIPVSTSRCWASSASACSPAAPRSTYWKSCLAVESCPRGGAFLAATRARREARPPAKIRGGPWRGLPRACCRSAGTSRSEFFRTSVGGSASGGINPLPRRRPRLPPFRPARTEARQGLSSGCRGIARARMSVALIRAAVPTSQPAIVPIRKRSFPMGPGAARTARATAALPL